MNFSQSSLFLSLILHLSLLIIPTSTCVDVDPGNGSESS